MTQRDDILSQLATCQVETVVVEFSGGNDNGGPENLIFIFTNGKTQHVDPSSKNAGDFLPAGVMDWLCDLPSERYGSFAGEYHVTGQVEVNVKKNTITIKGTETVEDYKSFEEAL